jgi:hypothetical protein
VAISLTNLTDEVNRKLGNSPRWTSCTLVGDASTKVFNLRDSPVVSGSLTVTGTPTVDYETGTLTYSSPPGAGNFTATYQYQYWSLSQVQEAINAALMELWPHFYKRAQHTISTTSAASYSVSASVLGTEGELLSLYYDTVSSGGSAAPLSAWWLTMASNGDRTLWFGAPPIASHTLTMQLALPPVPFPCVTPGSEYLETTAGLPVTARGPLVLYACSLLEDARAARRSREDRGHDTQMEDTVSLQDIVALAKFYREAADALAARTRMQPLMPSQVRKEAP